MQGADGVGAAGGSAGGAAVAPACPVELAPDCLRAGGVARARAFAIAPAAGDDAAIGENKDDSASKSVTFATEEEAGVPPGAG